jgi:hypothetical protein
MAIATKKPRPWTKEDVRHLKTLVREKTRTGVVARTLKRTEGATRQKASTLGVKLGRHNGRGRHQGCRDLQVLPIGKAMIQMHKFKVGQIVQFHPDRNERFTAPAGAYEITKRLPHNGQE